MMIKVTYRINVRTLSGKMICFKGVTEVKNQHGTLVFIDSKTGKEKMFPHNNCEVVEE